MKSLSNRILPLAALSQGTTVVDNLLDSDDIHYMLRALETLGWVSKKTKRIKEQLRKDAMRNFLLEMLQKRMLNCSWGMLVPGTAMHPLTAAVAVAGGNGCYILEGVPRMR